MWEREAPNLDLDVFWAPVLSSISSPCWVQTSTRESSTMWTFTVEGWQRSLGKNEWSLLDLGFLHHWERRPDSLSRSTFYCFGDCEQQNGSVVLAVTSKINVTSILVICLDSGRERARQASPGYLRLAQILQSSCLSPLSLAMTSMHHQSGRQWFRRTQTLAQSWNTDSVVL